MPEPNERPEEPGEPTQTHRPTDREPPHTLPFIPGEATHAPNSPGSVRYRPVQLHARGGLGEVYLADDNELHREVALKRIRPAHAANPDALRRFVREAEITARLQHPGIVPVYGLVWDESGQPWYAMRFVRGESLQSAIDQFHLTLALRDESPNYRFALSGLLSRFVMVCDTLAYAHSRGVIHRDLKPDNILLGPFGETLVADWGLARPFRDSREESAAGARRARTSLPPEDLTQTGAILGTPAFMSPEQAAGEVTKLTPASDIYSLGAILYAILTGRAPFKAENLPALLARVRSGQFPPPRQVNEDLPLALEAICLKAMATSPADRYRTAQELSGDIQRWLADEPVTAYGDSFFKRLRRWERRVGRWYHPHMHRVHGMFALFVLAVWLFSCVSCAAIESKLRDRNRKLEEELREHKSQLYKMQSQQKK
jgi:eukaryotic-like serine/threonine-protein kinase